MAEGGQAGSKVAGLDPLIGRTISDRFKLIALIARGGMGKVYRAEQAPLGRACAVKVLDPRHVEHDPEFHKRFFLEASIASKLTHPNTVTIFDYGQTEDEIYFMAMELLDGLTLHRAIREAGFLPEERVAHIGRQVCRALREAHAHGVIHRDLKPANIFLVDHGDESDFVKVLDFGLVKNVMDPKPEDQLTQTGLFMGSPKYMAPEQVRGDPVDARTDVYSLGILMYEMLTGKVPFDRPNSMNILMAHMHDEAPPLATMNPNAHVSLAMQELVARCMAKDPAARAASMDEVLAALKRLGGGPSATGTGEFPLSVSASGSLPAMSGRDFRSSRPPPAPPSYPPLSGEPPGSPPLVFRSAISPASATPPPTEMPERRRGRKAMAAGLVCVVAGAALLVAVSRRGTAGDPVTPASASQPAPSPPSATAPPPPLAVTSAPSLSVAPPTALKTHLTSDPAGAVVREDGREICPTTPCDHDFDPDATRDHKLVFSKPGFRNEARTIHAGDSPVAVRLTAAHAWTPPAQPKPAETNATTPQGFKEIPY